MIWLLALAALAADVTASGTRVVSVTITLVAHIAPRTASATTPPAVLVNRAREPFDRYADTENRRAIAARRPTNA